jgi:FMN-dependent NADH-azoreductase
VTVLHIDASINGGNSASRAISLDCRPAQVRAVGRGGRVPRSRPEPAPHLTLDAFADTSALDEFLAADTVVIGAPMYNLTLPTQFRVETAMIFSFVAMW